MQYNLNSELDRQRFKVKVKQLWTKGGIVEVTEKRRRTLSQNNYFFLILNCFAAEIGETTEFVKQEVFKRICNPDLFLITKENPILGTIEVLRSSRDLTTHEMSVAIDRYRKWCAEQGVYIPEANEEENLASLEAELSKYERYL
jgi:hypothetical protein